MVSLLDVAPVKQTVKLGSGQELEVGGISALGVAHLMNRFPDIRKLFAEQAVEFSYEALLELVPGLVEATIAAGCGLPGNKDAEKNAAALPIGDQMALLDGIIKQTIPAGLDPFVAQVRGLLGKGNAVFADGGKGQDTN